MYKLFALRFFAMTFWALLPLLLTGCSDLAVTQSGFLKDYTVLKPCKFDKKLFQDTHLFIYQREGVNWSRYSCAIVEPVEITGPAKFVGLKAADEKTICQYLRQSIMESLGRNNYVNVDRTKTNAIRVRAAVTDIDVSEPLINAVTLAAVRMPLDIGGSSIEVEITDAITGQVLCSMAAFGNGNVFQVLQSLEKTGQAQLAIDTCTRQLAEKIKHEPVKMFAAAKPNPDLAPF